MEIRNRKPKKKYEKENEKYERGRYLQLIKLGGTLMKFPFCSLV